MLCFVVNKYWFIPNKNKNIHSCVNTARSRYILSASNLIEIYLKKNRALIYSKYS